MHKSHAYRSYRDPHGQLVRCLTESGEWRLRPQPARLYLPESRKEKQYSGSQREPLDLLFTAGRHDSLVQHTVAGCQNGVELVRPPAAAQGEAQGSQRSLRYEGIVRCSGRAFCCARRIADTNLILDYTAGGCVQKLSIIALDLGLFFSGYGFLDRQ